MAFFNLWSSERLSFSLSVVAVISAAITSYYQFFYSQTGVSMQITSARYTVNDSNGIGTLQIQGVFMNPGTVPLALTRAHGFLTNDTTRNDGKIDGYIALFSDWHTYVERKSEFKPEIIEVESSMPFSKEWKLPHTKVKKLIDSCRVSGRVSPWNDNHVQLKAGMYLSFVTPKAEASSARTYPISVTFDVSDSLSPRTLSCGFSPNVYRFPIFEPVDTADRKYW